MRKSSKEVLSMVNVFSLLMWLTGKILALKGLAVMGITFELVSKVSGRE